MREIETREATSRRLGGDRDTGRGRSDVSEDDRRRDGDDQE